MGLLGGSFDPIHNGHLALARAALGQLRLAEVRFIPAARAWQKPPLTDAHHRVRMVELAIRGESGFAVDTQEIDRGGATYTIDTLRALRNSAGADTSLVLIVGSDQLARFNTWRDWRAIIDFAHVAVTRRAAEPLALNSELNAFFEPLRAEPDALFSDAAGALVEFDMPPEDACATEIRALLRRSPDDPRLAQVVPPAVLDYIRSHRLYA